MINLLHLKPLEILCEGKLGETHFKFMTVLFEALMFRRRNKIINAMTSLLFGGILTHENNTINNSESVCLFRKVTAFTNIKKYI